MSTGQNNNILGNKIEMTENDIINEAKIQMMTSTIVK